MRIICDIGHPAHVHLFKHMLWELGKRGHNYLITARNKDFTPQLLEAYAMPHVLVGDHYCGVWKKAYGLIKYDRKLLHIARQFDPDIFVSHGSVYAAHVAGMMRRPHIALEDTGNMEQIRLYRPFTQAILTPSCFDRDLGAKQLYYDGYHELAYLHPVLFEPDNSVLDGLHLRQNDKYIIVRFVSWEATHDIGEYGLNRDKRLELIEELASYAKVYISSENTLPSELRAFRIEIAPEKMHHVLHYAAVVVSEGAKIAAEAAVLGVPTVYVNTQSVSYIKELESKYRLLCHCTDRRNLPRLVHSLLSEDAKSVWKERREVLLKDKIDVTRFLIWFLEEYPESARIMKKYPDYQMKFMQA